jgi:hypothetical protein
MIDLPIKRVSLPPKENDIDIYADCRELDLCLTDRITSGQRRTLVEEYYASLSWHRQDDADRFLKILGYALAQQYASDEPRQKLRTLCEREGSIVDGIQVYFGVNRSGAPLLELGLAFVSAVKPNSRKNTNILPQNQIE